MVFRWRVDGFHGRARKRGARLCLGVVVRWMEISSIKFRPEEFDGYGAKSQLSCCHWV